jgi:hypothetical protein
MHCLTFNSTRNAVRRGWWGVARRSAWLLQIVLGCAALAGTLAASVRAQEVIDPRLEYNVKAASIYAFGRYVTWPNSVFENDKSPFVIGVFGNNPFFDSLDRIAAKKTVNERPIVIRLLKSVNECETCHIVFIPRTVPRNEEAEVLAKLAGKPVLLVGESSGFTERGGIINFYQSGSNVRFELNSEKGIEARLSLNAKLLSLGAKGATPR